MWPVVEVIRWLLTANSLKILCSCTKALAAEQLRGECFVILHFHVDLVMVRDRIGSSDNICGLSGINRAVLLAELCALQPGAGDFTKAS